MDKIIDLISVVVPYHNAEKTLKDCIGSILSQTYSNIEVICVNDGSEDDSVKVVKGFSDHRIISIEQERQGVSAARNRGIEEAKGRYIMFVDADDTVDSTIIEALRDRLEDDIDIIGCCCKYTLKGRVHENFFYGECFTAGNKEQKKKLFLQLIDPEYGQPQKPITAFGVPWGKLYRTDFLRKNNLKFDKKLKRMQDNVFNEYAFLCAQCVRYINVPLYNYNVSHIMGVKAFEPKNYLEILKKRQALKTYYMDDRQIQTKIYAERIWTLGQVIRLYAGSLDGHGFRHEVRKISDMTWFKEIGQDPFGQTRLGIYNKSIIFMIKKNYYLLLYLLTKIMLIKERVRSHF